MHVCIYMLHLASRCAETNIQNTVDLYDVHHMHLFMRLIIGLVKGGGRSKEKIMFFHTKHRMYT